jgi:hypothetical protein
VIDIVLKLTRGTAANFHSLTDYKMGIGGLCKSDLPN